MWLMAVRIERSIDRRVDRSGDAAPEDCGEFKLWLAVRVRWSKANGEAEHGSVCGLDYSGRKEIVEKCADVNRRCVLGIVRKQRRNRRDL